MQDFAAIDFETANNERSSVCSVGVVVVRGGEMMPKHAPGLQEKYCSYIRCIMITRETGQE